MKIFITRDIPSEAIEFLKKKKYTVVVHKKSTPLSREEFIRSAKDADGIIPMLSEKIDATVINELKKCRIIANYAVGYNNIDIKCAKQKNIVVTNTPDVLTNATADIAMGLALACARRFNEGEELVRTKKFTGWQPKLLLGIEFINKTFGIIGGGRIGTATAERAKAFGCKIIYYSRSVSSMMEKTGAKKVSLTYLLKNSDFVSLHIPLTTETYHLLDKQKLSLLKQTAILVNTARGEIVDEKELIKLLKQKKIFSAGFDVYENEPSINPELLKLKNVVLLPHIGSATFDTRREMAMLAAKNVVAVLTGKKAITPVV